MLNEERIKDIAISKGYPDSQIEIVFNTLKQSNIHVIEKEDYMFDIKNINTNEFIHKKVSIEMVMEIGFDILRMAIEEMIKENADEVQIFELLRDLNTMYTNKLYVIREVDGEKYLALEI